MIMSQRLIVPSTTVYREVSDELVVIEIESGLVYYFSLSTRYILDYFQKPSTLEALIENAAKKKGYSREEERHLTDFISFLKEKALLVDCADKSQAAPAPEEGTVELSGDEYVRPRFLSLADKTLDEITLLD